MWQLLIYQEAEVVMSEKSLNFVELNKCLDELNETFDREYNVLEF